MKKIIIAVIILGCFISNNFAWAKFPDDLPGPHLMPDSKLYFLKIWWEKIVVFFTFDLAKKAEKYKTFAAKRAYEAKEMIKKGKQDLADKQKELYRYYLNKAQEKLEKAIQKAMEKKKEDLKKDLEKQVEDIKIKLKQSFKL